MKTDLLDTYRDYLISQNNYATSTGKDISFPVKLLKISSLKYLHI